jgi:hypothetical protein
VEHLFVTVKCPSCKNKKQGDFRGTKCEFALSLSIADIQQAKIKGLVDTIPLELHVIANLSLSPGPPTQLKGKASDLRASQLILSRSSPTDDAQRC